MKDVIESISRQDAMNLIEKYISETTPEHNLTRDMKTIVTIGVFSEINIITEDEALDYSKRHQHAKNLKVRIKAGKHIGCRGYLDHLSYPPKGRTKAKIHLTGNDYGTVEVVWGNIEYLVNGSWSSEYN
jgi:hypothetical protein